MTVSDAALAAAAATNATAFAAIYRRFGDALHAFCLGMLRDSDAAADCVHDVFVTAATRLGQLRQHDKLRPWLYAIARHEALRRLKHRRREQPVDELPDAPDSADGPERDIARRELAELVAAATGGLSDRERTVLELHYRHGLDGPALADALGVSASNANTLVGRLRTTVERSLGALLVARHHADQCAELAGVLDGWDGRLTVLMRKRIARHIDHCPSCARARHDLVDPRALLASGPVAIPAPDWLEEHVLTDAAPLVNAVAAPASAAGTVDAASWWPAGVGAGSKTVVAVVAPIVSVAISASVVLATMLAGPVERTEATTALADTPAPPGVVEPPQSQAPRFALDPSTTRYAPTAPSSTSESATTPRGAPTTRAKPAVPSRGGAAPEGGAAPAPSANGPSTQRSAPLSNDIGIPVIPPRYKNRNTDPPSVTTPSSPPPPN